MKTIKVKLFIIEKVSVLKFFMRIFSYYSFWESNGALELFRSSRTTNVKKH